MRNLVNKTQVNWLSKKVFIFQLNNQTVEKRISGLVKRLLVFTLRKSCVLNSSWSFPVLLGRPSANLICMMNNSNNNPMFATVVPEGTEN